MTIIPKWPYDDSYFQVSLRWVIYIVLNLHEHRLTQYIYTILYYSKFRLYMVYVYIYMPSGYLT